MGRDWKSFEIHVQKSLDWPEEIVGRDEGINSTSDKISDGNEEHNIENWREGCSHY